MGMRYAYERRWGAEVLPDGGARFRLWAPALNALSLSAGAGGATEPMRKGDDGWFELETDLIKAGDPYLFQLPDGMKVPDPLRPARLRMAERGLAGQALGRSHHLRAPHRHVHRRRDVFRYRSQA